MNNNLIFGGQLSSTYASAQNLTITALNNFTYALNNLTFGVVYYDSNGNATSEYVKQLSTSYPVEFAANFRGLGLPKQIYN